MHLKEFLSAEIIEKCESETNYPVGTITTPYGTIEVRFSHYNSFIEAVDAWTRRAKRADYDNICIVLNAEKAVSEDLIVRFGRIPYEKIVLLTAEADTQKYPYCYNMKCFESGFRGSLIRYKNSYSTKRYLDEFNIDKFVNR